MQFVEPDIVTTALEMAILAENTGQPYERIERDTDRDYIMSPEEAIEYGVIDNIVRNH